MKNEEKDLIGFISDPKTIKEFEHNAHFQFDNVAGWMSAPYYDVALIKARYLVEALEALVEHTAQAQNSPSKHP